MHGNAVRNQSLLEGLVARTGSLQEVDCAVCVPFPYISQAQALLVGSVVGWGAQNVSERAEGAFTGEVSVSMLSDFGCRYVIVGHSERRSLFGESDELVAAKAGAVLENGLTPIVCVGESLEERDRNVTQAVVSRQLDAVVSRIGAEGLGNLVVAYEPVWAIGTGKMATPQQAQAVHAFLRNRVTALDAGVGVGVEQRLDRMLRRFEGLVEQLRGESESVGATGVDWGDVEFVAGLQVGPKPGIRRGGDEHCISRIGDVVEEDLQNASGPRQHRDLRRIELSTQEGPPHELAQLLAEPARSDHLVVTDGLVRQVGTRSNQARLEQIPHQLVLGDTQPDVPVRIGLGVVAILAPVGVGV